MEDIENFRINYFALYPKKTCLLHDSFPPITDCIEGFDFIQNKIICERVRWEPSLVQICLKDIFKISLEDLKSIASLFLNKNDSGDILSWNFREITDIVVYKYERIHIKYNDETYFFIYNDGSGFGFINDPNDFPIKTRFFGHEYLRVYDFLRNMGYALPFMNLKVKEMIDLKWIHIIDNQ